MANNMASSGLWKTFVINWESKSISTKVILLETSQWPVKTRITFNNDTRSNFLKEQNQNCSRPQAFAKITYHGFFKCEGKCYPNFQLEIVLENVIINYILLMMFNFN